MRLKELLVYSALLVLAVTMICGLIVMAKGIQNHNGTVAIPGADVDFHRCDTVRIDIMRGGIPSAQAGNTRLDLSEIIEPGKIRVYCQEKVK